MTAEREESKYLVSEDEVDCLVAALGQALASHRFTGDNANPLPDPRHFVTTVYFDTPGRMHFRIASSNLENNVKLRAKEYYDAPLLGRDRHGSERNLEVSAVVLLRTEATGRTAHRQTPA